MARESSALYKVGRLGRHFAAFGERTADAYLSVATRVCRRNQRVSALWVQDGAKQFADACRGPHRHGAPERYPRDALRNAGIPDASRRDCRLWGMPLTIPTGAY